MKKKNLKGLSREELTQLISEIGEKPFRSKQIWSWIYFHRITQFEQMTNIAKPLRQKLSEMACISSLKTVQKSESKSSGTVKFLFELQDGKCIESVYIPEKNRRTLCISTQVGCALGCRFCATGSMGFIRNLKPHEIVDQVICAWRELEERPTNIVVMGMGEPFLNYANVIKALNIINDADGIAIGHRKITISTAGVIPQLRKYTKEGHLFKLAISLNATTDSVRSKLMPINKKYPIDELLKAAKEYTKQMKKRLTFEYVLLKDVNDTALDAKRLLRLLSPIPCKVNLIAYNGSCGQFERPDDSRIQAFAESIREMCAPVTLRLSKGDDIDGACGQLVTKKG